VLRSQINHCGGEGELVVQFGKERPRTALDIEHETCQALRDFLAHDARGDQRDHFDGGSRIAQRVQLLIGGNNLARLSEHHAADLFELALRFGEREAGSESRDRLELVQRSAGMA
jgi:hypothetical protein